MFRVKLILQTIIKCIRKTQKHGDLVIEPRRFHSMKVGKIILKHFFFNRLYEHYFNIVLIAIVYIAFEVVSIKKHGFLEILECPVVLERAQRERRTSPGDVRTKGEGRGGYWGRREYYKIIITSRRSAEQEEV